MASEAPKNPGPTAQNPGGAQHVAIIMDGNGRWAQGRGLVRIRGHKNGVESVRAVTRHAARLGLRQLTLFAFSTENWKRPATEVAYLMRLLRRYLIDERRELMDNRIRLRSIGRIEGLTPDVVKALTEKMNAWAGSLGAALTHQTTPAKLDAKPAPEGELLEVTVTVTAQAKPSDRLIVPVASFAGNQFATDYVEYDVACASDSLRRGFFYSPLKGNDSKAITINFRRCKSTYTMRRRVAPVLDTTEFYQGCADCLSADFVSCSLSALMLVSSLFSSTM